MQHLRPQPLLAPCSPITRCPAGNTADSKGKAALGSGTPGTQPAELAVLQHKKVINAAYFSPITGKAGRQLATARAPVEGCVKGCQALAGRQHGSRTAGMKQQLPCAILPRCRAQDPDHLPGQPAARVGLPVCSAAGGRGGNAMGARKRKRKEKLAPCAPAAVLGRQDGKRLRCQQAPAAV